MSEITWATDELREQMLSALAEANLRPDECEAHSDEGAWIAFHKYAFQTNVVVNYEAKGFIVEDTTTGYAQGVDGVYIRFRLPDAPAEAAPRYYVGEASDGDDHPLIDRETDEVLDWYCYRDKAEKRANELNAANAPTPVTSTAECIELKADGTTTEAFIDEHPALTALKALRVDELSPIEALTKLRELKRLLGEG